jgi:hypothetical protein
MNHIQGETLLPLEFISPFRFVGAIDEPALGLYGGIAPAHDGSCCRISARSPDRASEAE